MKHIIKKVTFFIVALMMMLFAVVGFMACNNLQQQNEELKNIIRDLEEQKQELLDEKTRLERELYDIRNREITANDFALLVFTDRTTFNQGESIEVTAKFFNMSGQRLEIVRHGRLIAFRYRYRVYTSDLPGHPCYLELGDIITQTVTLGNRLTTGEHEVIVGVNILIRRGWIIVSEMISLRSNIRITVV